MQLVECLRVFETAGDTPNSLLRTTARFPSAPKAILLTAKRDLVGINGDMREEQRWRMRE
jgi:hypothetical protein